MSKTTSTQEEGFRPNTSLESWLERVSRLSARFDKMTAGNSQQFVEDLCLKFLQDNSKDNLHIHSTSLSSLQKSIYKYHGEVLQENGVGAELAQVETVCDKICQALSWVDELFCHAMVGWDEVKRLHTEKAFTYQIE